MPAELVDRSFLETLRAATEIVTGLQRLLLAVVDRLDLEPPEPEREEPRRERGFWDRSFAASWRTRSVPPFSGWRL